MGPSSWATADANAMNITTTSTTPAASAECTQNRPEVISNNDTPAKCFLPLLHPSANWVASNECAERYKYVFLSSQCSALKQDLYKFLGQLIGIAVRSRITLDLNLPSLIWKFVVGERLADTDIASFDVAASDFVQHLGSLYGSLDEKKKEKMSRNDTSHTNGGEWGAEDAAIAENSIDEAIYSLEEEIKSIIQDLTWTATSCDGVVTNLVPNGQDLNVTIDSLEEYLKTYVECRLYEFLSCCRGI